MSDEHAELVENVKRDARVFLDTLKEAIDGGVPQPVLMPELLSILRESGMMPDMGGLGAIGGLLGR